MSLITNYEDKKLVFSEHYNVHEHLGYDLCGVIFNSKPEKGYFIRWHPYVEGLSDSIIADRMIIELIKLRAEEQVSVFSQAHRNSYKHFKVYDEHNLNNFYKYFLGYIGERPEPRYNIELEYGEFHTGVILCSINGTRYNFDLKSESFINAYTPLFKLIYGSSIYPYAAYDQYVNGKAPAAYCEIAALNEFLKGKRRVHIHMKDGEVCTKEDCYDMRFESIFELSPVKDNVTVKIRNYAFPGQGDYQVDDICYLAHGKKKYSINYENLKKLSEL